MSTTKNNHSASEILDSPEENGILQNAVTQEQINELVKKINTFISEYNNGITHLLRERETALSNVRNRINEINSRESEARRTLETIRTSAIGHLSSQNLEEPYHLSLKSASDRTLNQNLLETAERHVASAQQSLQNLKSSRMPGYLLNIVGVAIVLGLVIGGCTGIANKSFNVFMVTALFIAGAGGGLAMLIYQNAKSSLLQHFSAIMLEKDTAEQYLQKCPSLIAVHNKEGAEAIARSYQSFIGYSEVMKNKSEALQAECAEIWDNTGFAGWGWDAEQWERWSPPSLTSPSVSFGGLENYRKLITGVTDESLQFFDSLSQNANFPQVNLDFDLPAVMSLSKGRGLVFETSASAKARATDAVRSIMLRLLATMPAGMVYFTMIDPVAMGDNVAAFIPLGKYDEKLRVYGS